RAARSVRARVVGAQADLRSAMTAALAVLFLLAANPTKVEEIRLKGAQKKKEAVSAPRLAEPPGKNADLFRCTSCHAPLTADRKPHNPLKNGECSACHVANPGTVGKCRSPAGTAWKLVA